MDDGQEWGERMLARVVDRAQRTWGDRLIAVYALGSLAHGGFAAEVSDIDAGLILSGPLDQHDGRNVAGLSAAIAESNEPFSDRLSIFWGSIATVSGVSPGGRFPPLDRLDLMQFGRLLAGRDVRSELPLPTQEELVLVGAEFAHWRLARGDVIATLKDPKALLRSEPKTLTKLILYPVRFLFTARTGGVGRNEAAVEHFIAGAERPAATLASMALRWRHAPPGASDRVSQEAIARGILPLYQEFLLDHEARLQSYGRADLAEAFRNWREELQA
jgi:predicted nucleotidyltransferase